MQIISSQQFDMTTFSLRRGVTFDHHFAEAEANTLDGSDVPGLATSYSYDSQVSNWNGSDMLSGATEQSTFLGMGLSANAWNTVNSGTVTGLVSGSATAGTYFLDFSLAASVVQEASQSFTDNQIHAIFKSLLTGDDRIILSAKADTIAAGNGADYVAAGAGNDRIYGQVGADNLNGQDGRDLISGGYGNDRLTGGYGNDTLKGDQNRDRLFGNQGEDRLDGGADSDALYGGYGCDTLLGGTGADRLSGAQGRDELHGGVDTNADSFVFEQLDSSSKSSNRDLVFDFVSGTDKINVSGLDANMVTAGDQSFTFSGTTAAANALWYVATDGNVIVYADVTGDTKADFSLQVMAVTALAQGDFVL